MNREFAIDTLQKLRVSGLPLEIQEKWDLESAIKDAIQALRTVPVAYTKQTNSQKIRNMTEKELAAFLDFLLGGYLDNCIVCAYRKECPLDKNKHTGKDKNACKKGVLEWLRKEVKDGDEAFGGGKKEVQNDE